MKSEEKTRCSPANLAAYRDGKRKERYIQRSIEKTGVLRSLLHEGLVEFNRSSVTDQQIIAFALNDVLRSISQEVVDHLRSVLRNVSAGRLPD
jgi:predicted deacylase